MRRLLALLVALAGHAWAAPSIVLPSNAAGLGQAFTNTNTLHCIAVPAPFTATYTKLGGWVEVGVSTSTTGFAIYPDTDGGTQLGEVVGTSDTSNDDFLATGLSISLTAGTRYRVCACGTSTSIQYLAMDDASTGSGRFVVMLNAGGLTTTLGTAAEPCISGNPPSTTGAITGATNFRPPMIVLEE